MIENIVIVCVMILAILCLWGLHCIGVLRKKVYELERQVWELRNPPKYKINQKITYSYKDLFTVKGVVVSMRSTDWDDGRSWSYQIFDGKELRTYKI